MGEEGQAVNQAAEETTSPTVSASADMPQGQQDSVVNRRSRWISSFAALRYVNSVSRDEEIKTRDSDRATSIALFICCVMAFACLVVPALEHYRMGFVIAADVLVGVAMMMYVANRFGVLTTFRPRQALLTWQLMLGSSLLGIFLTINLALILALLMPLLLQNVQTTVAR